MNHRVFSAFVIAILFCGMAFPQSANPAKVYQGNVIDVPSGDTIKLITKDLKSAIVTLEFIDAPEKGQDFADKSSEALKKMLITQEVTVKETETRGGKTFAKVTFEKKDVALSQVENGWAWHVTPNKGGTENDQLAEAEKAARSKKVGLWAGESPIAPWNYQPKKEAPQTSGPKKTYWLNTKSNVRHNSKCKNFHNTKSGRECGPDEGRACHICGG